jgi:hypothetical protein
MADTDNGTQKIVDKAWNFAHALRDDGLKSLPEIFLD